MAQRVYVIQKDARTGATTAVPTGYTYNQETGYQDAPVQYGMGACSCSDAMASGGMLVDGSQLARIRASSTLPANSQNGYSAGTAANRRHIQAGGERVLQMSFTVSNTDTAPVQLPVFDAYALRSTEAGLPLQLPATVVVNGGTYGTTTLSRIRQISETLGYHLVNMKIEAGTEAMLNALKVSDFKYNCIGSSEGTTVYNPTAARTAQDYNPKISAFKDRFNVIATGLYALVFTLPAQSTFTVTFDIVECGDVRTMVAA
jgi:hypothetical protein